MLTVKYNVQYKQASIQHVHGIQRTLVQNWYSLSLEIPVISLPTMYPGKRDPPNPTPWKDQEGPPCYHSQA